MPFDLQDIEQLAHAIAHMNGHPSAHEYAQGVAKAWHELFSPEAQKPAAPEGEPANADAPQA